MRRMGFNKEYIRTVTKHNGSSYVDVGNLEPGLYQLKINVTDDEYFYTTFVELEKNVHATYQSPLVMYDKQGVCISCLACLAYKSILNNEAIVEITAGDGAQIPWADSEYTNIVDIYRLR